jgi:DNA-binding response OmpR family regulator
MPNWRIMIVDDDDEIINIVQRVLETEFEVTVAHNGLDALEKVDRYEPDFIILDVMMPLMNGFETCSALRKIPAYMQTPIYFLTSSSSREDVKKGYAHGCNLYLQKPFDPFRLLKNIKFYIEKNPIEAKVKKYSMTALKKIAEIELVPEKVEEIPEKTGPVPRIMVIDDVTETLEFIEVSLNLAEKKFEVITTSDPIDALSQIVHYQPDIILLDIRMPKLDGFQLCKIIKINQNLQNTEIQFISGTATKKDFQIARSLTGNSLIAKPFDMKDIAGKVAAICEKPGFKAREKRMAISEVFSEIAKQKQEEDARKRKEFEKQYHKKKMEPLKKFYNELEKDR